MRKSALAHGVLSSLLFCIQVANGQDVLFSSQEQSNFSLVSSSSDMAELRQAKLDQEVQTNVLELATLKDTTPSWNIEARASIDKDIAAGDVIVLHFKARYISSSNEIGALANFYFQRGVEPWEKSLSTEINLTREWRDYTLPFVLKNNFKAGESVIGMGVGYKRQIIQISDLSIVNYHQTKNVSEFPAYKNSYAGREADAPWRTAALERIENIRKSDFIIRVVDDNGTPIPNVNVSISLKRHAFDFGSAFVMSYLTGSTQDAIVYREKAVELFTSGCPENDLKWQPWLETKAQSVDLANSKTLTGLQWLKDHQIRVRGHVLVWPSWANLPDSVSKLRHTEQKDSILDLVDSHIVDITSATKGLVSEWDVLNEPYDNHDLMDMFGKDIMGTWFQVARNSLGNDVKLCLNDYANHDMDSDSIHLEFFQNAARTFISNKVPVDILGLQCHFGTRVTAPERLLATLDTYNDLELPLRITEFDVDTSDEQLQADYTRDFLIAVFSHPNVVGFQMWGFWEGAHWRPSAAMYRKDWSEKPNAHAYKDLVLNKWQTNISGKTDATGTLAGRGFLGDYIVLAEKNGKTVSASFLLTKNASASTLLIKFD